MKGDARGIDWDAYWAAYPTMTYEQVAEFHRLIWDVFPDQCHHSREALDRFFAGSGPISVVELGGWRGEAAAWLLDRHPAIARWVNIEICEPAVRAPATQDPRYRPVFPDRWAWDLPPAPFDVAVLAHVIEHILPAQLNQLVAWLAACGVRRVYVEAPLLDAGQRWRHSTSSHLLEIGWAAVVALFGERGYKLVERIPLPTRDACLFEAAP